MKAAYFSSITLVLLALTPPLLAREIHVSGDHETIQGAIDAASPGDEIVVAAGTYRERITLKPRLRLRSAGDDTKGELGLARAEATIIDGGGAAGDEPGVSMAEGSSLDGFTVTNVGLYEEASWKKHWDERGVNQPHEHIGGFGVPGIGIDGVTCTVSHNLVHHIGTTGIAIRGADDTPCAPLVTGNICYRNMGGGIGSMHGSTAIIQGNICFENFFAGIGHDDASPMVIDNDCYENIRAGIGISEGASPLVRGNRCFRNRRAGIGIRTGNETRPLIENNDCYENGMAGIGIDEEAAPVIRRNRCHHNRLAGIGCQEHARAILIENHCFENQEAGVGVDSAHLFAIENRCENNDTAGIGVSNGSHAVVVGGDCLENRLVAVGVAQGSEAVLIDLKAHRTGGEPPLLAVQKDASALAYRLTLEGGGVAAAMAAGKLYLANSTLTSGGGKNALMVPPTGSVLSQGNHFEGFERIKAGPGELLESSPRKSDESN